MATNLILVGFLVPFAFTTWPPVSGKLHDTPEDVVVALGETVQLNCSTDDTYGVNWWHVPVGSTTNEDIFISHVVVLPYHPRFKVERNEAKNHIHDYNLVITSVTRGDAGKYTCIDRVGHGEQKHAQLVVLESGPKCQTNINVRGFVGDNDCGIPTGEISCSCSLQYSGNHPPVMEWTNSAGQVIEPQPHVDTSQTNIISSELVVKSGLSMSGTSIVFRPELLRSKNWTSTEVKVKYAMKNGREVNVTHGESVVCSANSSETCTYRWTTQNGTIVSDVAHLTIVNTGTYFCDATCSLDHNECTVRSMVAAFKKPHEDDTTKAKKEMTLVVVGVIGIVLVSSFVALFVIFCYLRKKRKEKNCIPCDGDLLNQLKTENLMVVGVTILDRLMYVAHHGLNVISVYKTAPPFKLKRQIRMDELGEPRDMAACPLNRCLYITDSKNKCVWKLHVSDDNVDKATKWVENIDEPYTISVCLSGNVLMVRQPNTVAEYNAEGFVVEECSVYSNGPRIEDIQHAVENKQRNFIVSHGGKRDKAHAICEVSKDGGLVRIFGSDPGDGSRQLNNPRHVAVDGQDRVYVVDASNDRVLRLDKMFQDVFKLPCSARSQPLRLAVNSGRILIGKYGAVDVFSAVETKRLRSELNGEYSAVPMSESNSEEHS